jgi:hypothetical protein
MHTHAVLVVAGPLLYGIAVQLMQFALITALVTVLQSQFNVALLKTNPLADRQLQVKVVVFQTKFLLQRQADPLLFPVV